MSDESGLHRPDCHCDDLLKSRMFYHSLKLDSKFIDS